jgi:thioredoxin-related protein
MLLKYFKQILISFTITFLIFAQDGSNKKTHQFDPARDPFKDLKETIVQAKKENKRIILDVGGEWCIWCKRIDAFMNEDNDIRNTLERNFIILKVNYSKENKNEKFLSQFPEVAGYPHFFVLDENGKLLHSQNTGELEKDKYYSKEKFLSFLNKWIPDKKAKK